MYRNRRDAGQVLARALSARAWVDPVILALPRGGVPIADEVSRSLRIPFDLLVVRKIGAPDQPEYGLGAIAEGGATFVDRERARASGVSADQIEAVATEEAREVARRVMVYRSGRPLPRVAGRTVILVDDGIATGVTLHAAIRAARGQGAAKVVVAAPVGAASTIEELSQEADEVICPLVPEDLYAIGNWYADFPQLDDDEVRSILQEAWWRHDTESLAGTGDVRVDVDGVVLPGRLSVQQGARGLVLFAHGSGSSRLSPRNQFVADALQRGGLGTLLFDLLTTDEEQTDDVTGELRFNIPFLANRLMGAARWARRQRSLAHLPIGLFGASTGAAAALIAASREPRYVQAIVSRGGRPDLAGLSLPTVRAPTLLIVGGADEEVLELNREAFELLTCEKELRVVRGATHLFEERGTLAAVARLALEWFQQHLTAEAAAHP